MKERNWPENINFMEFESRSALANALASRVASELRDGIQSKGSSSLVVSGGSTPKPFFEALSEAELSWANVIVTLADERFIPADHPDSNERLIRNSLLQGNAASARFVPLYKEASDATASAKQAAIAIDQQIEKPDIVILGMGNDGHTASLFPGSPMLKQALSQRCEAKCLPMTPQSAPYDRITLTFPILASTNHLILHIVGDDKLETLQSALANDDVDAMPIRAFLGKKIDVYWAP